LITVSNSRETAENLMITGDPPKPGCVIGPTIIESPSSSSAGRFKGRR